jgi:hypothetical protein
MLSRNSRLILLLQNGRKEMATDTIFGAMLTKTATQMWHSINFFRYNYTENITVKISDLKMIITQTMVCWIFIFFTIKMEAACPSKTRKPHIHQ